jgi:hypothetical protein
MRLVKIKMLMVCERVRIVENRCRSLRYGRTANGAFYFYEIGLRVKCGGYWSVATRGGAVPKLEKRRQVQVYKETQNNQRVCLLK